MTDDEGQADLLVVETLNDRWRSHAQDGGRVLWLAEEPDSFQTHLGSWGLAGRHGRSWQGDWASSMSWIRQDRMFQDLPTGGTVDFAFADLTPETVIVGLSPRDYAANVHSGLFVGWVHHIVALVAERRIDKGRLMSCTYRLRDHLGDAPGGDDHDAGHDWAARRSSAGKPRGGTVVLTAGSYTLPALTVTRRAPGP